MMKCHTALLTWQKLLASHQNDRGRFRENRNVSRTLANSRTVTTGNWKRKCTAYLDTGLKIESFFAEVLREVAYYADPN